MAAIILSAWPRRSPTRCGACRAGAACKVRVDPAARRRGAAAGAARRCAPRPRRVAELAPWIERQLAELRAAARAARAAPGRCPTSTSASRSSPSRGARARTAAAASCSCRPATARAPAIERWYRRAARAEIARRLDARERGRRHALHAPDDPQPAHALGELRERRRDELQLAAAARPRARARLRRLARGLPPEVADHSPRLLGAARARAAPTGASRRRWLRENGAALVL